MPLELDDVPAGREVRRIPGRMPGRAEVGLLRSTKEQSVTPASQVIERASPTAAAIITTRACSVIF
jgi:hypothetical protein